jgi:phosphate transport system substrate-binding protein
MSKKVYAASLLTLAALAISACKSNSVRISGAGSTFVYPVMTRWVQDFSQGHPNVQINYQSIGSGGGVQQVKSKTVDFGASDAPLSDQQLTDMPPVIQIPETAGPVCITYNLPSLSQPLQLSPEALAGIFLGTIKSWQDPKIKADNPGVNLPDQGIVVVHRADGSGTTNAFTTYLSAVSSDWQSKVGKGNSVSWPIGLGGKGSEGVTGQPWSRSRTRPATTSRPPRKARPRPSTPLPRSSRRTRASRSSTRRPMLRMLIRFRR